MGKSSSDDEFVLEYIVTSSQKQKSIIFEDYSELCMLNSEHVVSFKNTYIIDSGICIVRQYCNGGTLKEKIKAGNIVDDMACDIIIGISSGLRDLHNMSIIHRDIKPDNLFFNNGKLLIEGLGLARKINDYYESVTSYIFYKAPEIYSKKKQYLKTDVWNLGLVVFVMFSGYFFEDKKNEPGKLQETKIQKFMKQELKDVDNVFINFVLSCTAFDLNKRWDSKTALMNALKIKNDLKK